MGTFAPETSLPRSSALKPAEPRRTVDVSRRRTMPLFHAVALSPGSIHRCRHGAGKSAATIGAAAYGLIDSASWKLDLSPASIASAPELRAVCLTTARRCRVWSLDECFDHHEHCPNHRTSIGRKDHGPVCRVCRKLRKVTSWPFMVPVDSTMSL